jgi:hypothetical protein
MSDVTTWGKMSNRKLIEESNVFERVFVVNDAASLKVEIF